MRNRRYLVAFSLSAHLAVVFGLFVAGFWRLDRLDAPRHTIDLAVAPTPPPAPSGSPSAAAPEPFVKKKPRVIPHVITQPTLPDPETKPATSELPPSDGDGGTGTGPGSGSGTDPKGTGDCVGEHCGPAQPEPEIKKVEPIVDKPIAVPPPMIRGMRISGETQIQPPDIEKTALLRSGKTRANATVKVCVGEAGNTTELTMFKGSGYAGWDAAILRALQNWRYKPHKIGDRAVTVCGMVTFIYEIH
jgi:TonB family protein